MDDESIPRALDGQIGLAEDFNGFTTALIDSTDNQKACRKAGIACASIPQRGGKKTATRQAFEKSPDFKKAQRFRAGIEGRISVLFRGRGMKRCLACGKERFHAFVGVAVLANNLMKIAELLIRLENKKKPRSRAA